MPKFPLILTHGDAMCITLAGFWHDSRGLFWAAREFFTKAKVLDAGCGDTAKLLFRFSQFGCKNLTSINLGTVFISIAE